MDQVPGPHQRRLRPRRSGRGVDPADVVLEQILNEIYGRRAPRVAGHVPDQVDVPPSDPRVDKA